MKSHKQQVALVTGSGKRLGRHIALALGERGFDVAVHYLTSNTGAKRTVKEIQDFGRKSASFKADISNKRSVQQLVKKVIAEFGRIDLLVNNAAIFFDGEFEKISEAMWDIVLDTNLKSGFLCSKAVAPYMIKQGRGRIINIASLGGIQPWGKRHLPYSVSKAGVIMLTRCLAKALAPKILVNAIAPGTIEMDEPASTNSQVSADTIPMKRYGTPEDITSTVLFLATSANYITGQIFSVDGGRSA